MLARPREAEQFSDRPSQETRKKLPAVCPLTCPFSPSFSLERAELRGSGWPWQLRTCTFTFAGGQEEGSPLNGDQGRWVTWERITGVGVPHWLNYKGAEGGKNKLVISGVMCAHHGLHRANVVEGSAHDVLLGNGAPDTPQAPGMELSPPRLPEQSLGKLAR